MRAFRPGVGEINWNLFHVFCIVAEEGNLSRAAVRLNMRQPSVTQALQKLERQLGCQLVYRDSRNFELTVRGEQVLAECNAIYRHAVAVRELTEREMEDAAGAIKLYLVSGLHSSIIDEAVRLMHQRAPSIVWQIEVGNSGDIVKEVARGHASVGICLLTRPVVNLDCRFLFREKFAIFCGSEHPLFGVENITLNDLRHEPFVSFTCASEGLGLEPVAVLREGGGLGSRTIGTSSSLEEVQRMIIAGLGIGVLPIAAAKTLVDAGMLWPLSITAHDIGADVYMVTNAKVKLGFADRMFVRIIEELLQMESAYPSAQDEL